MSVRREASGMLSLERDCYGGKKEMLLEGRQKPSPVVEIRSSTSGRPIFVYIEHARRR